MKTFPIINLVFFSLLLSCATPQSTSPTEPASTKNVSKPASKDGLKENPKEIAPPDYWKGRTDLIKLPELISPSALPLPPLKHFTLKNGLNVLIVPDHQLPLINIQLLLKAGNIDDPQDQEGLSDFVSDMLRHGTKRMDADTISTTVDGAGVSLHASNDYELTNISCHGRKTSTDLCLQMVSDLSLNPSFPEKEMAEVRDQLISSIKEARDDPATLAMLHFNNMLYSDDRPAGRPTTVESLKRITHQDLLAYYKRHFVPGAAVLGISGDVNSKEIEAKIKKAFGPWPKRPLFKRQIQPVVDPPSGLKVLLVDKPDLSQSFFCLGHAGISRTAPDRDAVKVMNYVLGGGGFSSRLMKTIRVKGGKTYGIRSQFEENSYDGVFAIRSFTRNDQLLSTLGLVQKELARLQTTPPTEQEIKEAKGDLAGGYALRIKTAAGLASLLLHAKIWGLPQTFVTELPVRISALSSENIAQAARQEVRPSHLAAAIVGKAAVVGPALKKAGIPYEQVDYLSPISKSQRQKNASASP